MNKKDLNRLRYVRNAITLNQPAQALVELQDMINEIEVPAQARKEAKEKEKQLKLRNLYRGTECIACIHNYYNFPKDKSPNGDVAVAEDYSCWHLKSIVRGRCPQKYVNGRGYVNSDYFKNKRSRTCGRR